MDFFLKLSMLYKNNLWWRNKTIPEEWKNAKLKKKTKNFTVLRMTVKIMGCNFVE